MKEWKMILTLVVVISFLLSCVSVNAQVNNGYIEKDWIAHHKLDISKHTLNKTFISNGVDKAKMNILIRNKTTERLADAQSNITVLIRSNIGILEPRRVTIVKDNLQSEEISLNSTQPGNVHITAEAVGFDVASASVEFKPPPDPCGLLLTADPNENVPADGVHSTTLTVKLIDSDSEPIKHLENICIHIWTNEGEKLPEIIIGKGKHYGQMDFTTYKGGTHTITAKSHDLNLENSTLVTFISPITLLTLIFAAFGGLLAGVFRYYQDYKDKIFFTKKIDGSWRLGIFGHSIFHSLFGTVVYIGASLSLPGTNVFGIPITIASGAFMIGLIGGLFFFALISSWSLVYIIKRAS